MPASFQKFPGRKPCLSVIVPVFNTEPWIEKCLRSIQAQTLEDIEIICVDDCSPDRSAEIVGDFASTDPRISLIKHDRNLGQGGARNTGIAVARANYIANVDSDDWIQSDMYQLLYDATESEDHDIVCCGWKRVDESGAVLNEVGRKPGFYDNSDNGLDIFTVLNPALWNKIFRKSLVVDNNLRFPNYLGYEDLATTPRLVSLSNRINIIADRPYNYVSRNDSVVSTYTPKHLVDYFEAFSVLRRFLIEQDLFAHYHDLFCAAIERHLSTYIQSLLESDLEDEKKRSLLKYLTILKTSFADVIHSVDHLSIEEMSALVAQRQNFTLSSTKSVAAA